MPKRTIYFILLLALSPANANQVEILSAEFIHKQQDNWTVKVSLKHNDTGWQHYANSWRIVDRKTSTVLGERILHHPHVNEQPFTRQLDVTIPETSTHVYIQAHDTQHGWSTETLEIDLSKTTDGRLKQLSR